MDASGQWGVRHRLRMLGFPAERIRAGMFAGDAPSILAMSGEGFAIIRLSGQRAALAQFAAHRPDAEDRLEHEIEAGDLNGDGFVDLVVLDAKEQMASIKKWIDTGAQLNAGAGPNAQLITIMPKLPQPLPPEAYRVPIPVTALQFSPDGNQLAASGYHEIVLWNPADGKIIRRITNVAERVRDIAHALQCEIRVRAAYRIEQFQWR